MGHSLKRWYASRSYELCKWCAGGNGKTTWRNQKQNEWQVSTSWAGGGWQLHLVRFQRLCWSMFCLSLSARRDVLLVAEAHLASAILRACFIGNRFPQEGLILLKWLSHTRASSKSASLESLTRASSKSALQGCLTRVSDKCGSCLPQKMPDKTKQCQKNEVNKTVGHGTLRQGMHTAGGSSSRNLRFV